MAGDNDLIDFFDAVTRVCESLCDGTVIGDDDEPLARFVQATNGKDTLSSGDEIDHTSATTRVPVRRQDTGGFVNQKILFLRDFNSFAINCNFLQTRIHFRPKLGYGLAIDFDTSLGN